MKNNIISPRLIRLGWKKLIVGMVAVFGFLLVASSAFAATGAPVMSTNSATNITATSATLNGFYNDNGSAMTDVFFAYEDTPNVSNYSSKGSLTTAGSGTYSVTVNGLNPGTTYYFQAVGTNGIGIGWATNILTFTTKSINVPVVSTNSATNIASTSAVLNGYFNSNNATTSTYFEYGTSANSLTNTTPTVMQANSFGSINNTAINLTPNTTYYFRAVAMNSAGTTYGTPILNFKTLPGVPIPTTCSINSFAPSAYSITLGSPVTLSWSTTNCNTANLTKAGSVLASGGSYVDYPSGTTTYYLTATGTSNTVSSQVTVTVTNTIPSTTCSINSFAPSAYSITLGSPVTLSWSTTNCNTANLTKAGSVLASGGSYVDYPSGTTTYYLTATGTSNTVSSQVTVTVNGYNPNPNPTNYCQVNYFSANTNNVTVGNAVTLSWSTSYCYSYTLSANGSYISSGSNNYGTSVVYPQTTTTYNLNAFGTYGSGNRSQTVTVNNYNPNPYPNPQPTPVKPQAVSTYVSSLKSTSATLQGTVYTNGVTPTYVYFEYGTTPSLGMVTSKYTIYGSSYDFKKSISYLNSDTTYYFRFVAENSNGTSYGNILYFKTAVKGQTIVTPVVNSYTDTSNTSSNTTNTSNTNKTNQNSLGAAVGMAGGSFLPRTAVGWLFLILFVLVVLLAARKFFGRNEGHSQSVH